MPVESFRHAAPLDYERQGDGQTAPKRYIVLSMEGVKTEVDYFRHIEKELRNCGLSAIMEIKILDHKHIPGQSAPSQIFERLRYYLDMNANGHLISTDEMKNLEQKFGLDILRKFLDNPESLEDADRKAIQDELFVIEINLKHEEFSRDLDPEFDHFGVVLDRDAGCHTREALLKILAECEKLKCALYLSNPCFDFWLLLHLVDAKKAFTEKQLLENEKISNKHTFVSNEVGKRANHAKHITYNTFRNYYFPNTMVAMERSLQFTTDPAEIVNKVGTNLAKLFEIMECHKWLNPIAPVKPNRK